jgi:hypothetical protein
MIKAAAANGYDVVIVDSLTHAWDALLAMKDKVAKKDRGQNSFTAWAKINPHHNDLIDTIVGTPIHIIGTIRAKSDYVMEEYTRKNGMKGEKPVKVGMKAMQREGFEYEFDVFAQMDIENRMIIEKSRCPALTGEVIEKPGAEVADTLRVWLSDGVEVAPATVSVDDIINANEGDFTPEEMDAMPQPAPRQSAPRPTPQQRKSPTVGDGKGNSPADPRDDGHGDDFPTIRQYWPSVADSLLVLPMDELPDGLAIAGIVGVQAEALGYANYDAVKQALGLKSSRDFGDTFEEFLSAVIDHAPKYNE